MLLGTAMVRELNTFLLVTSAAGTLQPLTIWKSIKIAKKALEFIGECPEWINYNRNLEQDLQNLRTKVHCLEGLQADVKTQLENTEFQSGKKRKREVDHWLTSVKRTALEVKKVENDVNSVTHVSRFLFRAWLGTGIHKALEQVSELHDNGKFPDGLLLDALPQDGGGEPFVTTRMVGGEKIDQIWAHLINTRITRIGIQGPEGIGKTAIMAQVYNRLYQCYRVYYVNVPQNFTVYSLQAAIAERMRVHLPLQEGSEARRAARILKVLDTQKEYVLFLDGLSRHFSLDEVGIPRDGNNGQKLILTSRDPDVCRRMSCQEIVVLERLSREEAESLFMEKLERDVNVTPLSEEIKDVAGAIVARCEGIPSRIIYTAIQLRGVSDINEWRNTLNEM